MRTWIEVSRKNLLHNLGEFRRLVGSKTIIMAVVKANAYGHGLHEVAGILKSEKDIWFAVDKREEGSDLRKFGIRQPILVLGYVPQEELPRAVGDHLDLTVYNKETINKLKAIGRPARVHIKLETGTTRQGVGERDAIALVKLITASKNITLVGASTHFANIEDTTDHSYAVGQLKKYNDIVRRISKLGLEKKPLLRHSAASAGTILFPDTHFNAVRVGISLYGYWPFGPGRRRLQPAMASPPKGGGYRPHTIDFRPVLTWKSIIAQIKNVPRGTPVSYGLTERTTRPSRLAVIPVGYYDGFDRGLSSVGAVLIRGRRAKVMGRVCMNMMMVDVTDIRRVTLEDEVVIVGRSGTHSITADELAQKTNTISYEVLSRINPTLKRIVA